MTAFCFSLLGFILGLWAKNFEQLNFVPTLIITPLVFLAEVSIVCSRRQQVVSMFNPAMYLISGFRWAFFGVSEVDPSLVSCGVLFAGLFLGVIGYLLRPGTDSEISVTRRV